MSSLGLDLNMEIGRVSVLFLDNSITQFFLPEDLLLKKSPLMESLKALGLDIRIQGPVSLNI